MPKLTPNIPYDDLGDTYQLAEYLGAWVMESSKSGDYLALSDFRPETCSCTVVRQASFNDIQSLVNRLPILSQRSYRIGTEHGIVFVKAVLIDRKYHWVVNLEPPITHKINNPPVVPERTNQHFTRSAQPAERFEVRSTLVRAKSFSSPIRRH